MKGSTQSDPCGVMTLARAPQRLLVWSATLALIAGVPFALCGPLAGPTPIVTLDLQSNSAGQTVEPGQTIHWNVVADVSQGDNLGLAMISVDIEQDAMNPSLFDLRPGVLDAFEMRSFDWPDGYANPGRVPKTSGFGGTLVGTPGARNLAQIGGGQNTFGVVGPCLGQDADICMGQKVDVTSGVGQAPGGISVAVGTFVAPRAPGVYTFRISGAKANVLEQINAAPAHSPVSRALVEFDLASFTVTVQ